MSERLLSDSTYAPGDTVRFEDGRGPYRVVRGEDESREVLMEGRDGALLRSPADELEMVHRVEVTEDNCGEVPGLRLRDDFLFADGQWFQVNLSTLRVMPMADAVLLGFLIAWQRFAGRTREEFYCTAATVSERIGMPPRTQTRVLASLERAGFVTTRMAGYPIRRLITIRYDEIIRAIMQGRQKGSKKRTKASNCRNRK